MESHAALQAGLCSSDIPQGLLSIPWCWSALWLPLSLGFGFGQHVPHGLSE
jgi:hypothetical protein